MILTTLVASLALAQDPSPWVDQTFVIVASERTFDAAMAKAGHIAVKSGIRLDFRGVGFDPAHVSENGGLTLSASECEGNGWDYPCYVPRGRWDSGAYLSIEYSSAVNGFTPGLYVVVAGTGARSELDAVLARVRPVVPDAYLKTAEVYMGCMH